MRHRHSTQKLPDTSLILIAVAVGALLLGYYASQLINPAASRHSLELANATLYPEDFRTMPPFKLLDEDGTAFTNMRFKGQWSLVFFGFTYCPDVCPNTLSLLAQVKTSLNDRADIQTLLISVDPERDTTEKLKPYVDYFDPAFIGITGDMEAIKTVTQYFGVFFAKTPNQDDSSHYVIDHSAGIFLLNPEGKLFALFSPPHDAAAITQDLQKILSSYPNKK